MRQANPGWLRSSCIYRRPPQRLPCTFVLNAVLSSASTAGPATFCITGWRPESTPPLRTSGKTTVNSGTRRDIILTVVKLSRRVQSLKPLIDLIPGFCKRNYVRNYARARLAARTSPLGGTPRNSYVFEGSRSGVSPDCEASPEKGHCNYYAGTETR
jgi:hypothetical protein